MMAQAFIGTSGWDYPDWQGRFYPEDLSREDRLGFYADTFRAVEINHTFYQLPSPETVESWSARLGNAPLLFAVKASRYLTHMKKLKDPQEPLQRLEGCLEGLGDRWAATLYQLPPYWKPNPERLAAFLECLPEGQRATVELRDERWFDEAILALLAGHNVACCVYDFGDDPSPVHLTADFAYVRLHGPGDKYKGSYGAEALDRWADFILEQLGEDRDVFCFFDNDEKAFAPLDAGRLRERVGQ
jgi:uncharacterized protein YecE (DUF72 family)